MIDLRDRKDLLVLLVIAVLIVLCILFFSLYMIWKPRDNNNEFRVGIIDTYDYTESQIVNEYFEEISELLKENDFENLYKIVSKDYIEYSSLTVEKLKLKCEEMKICGQDLKLESYEKNTIKEYNNVFIIAIKVVNSNVAARITINEKSPRNYNILFDDLIVNSTQKIIKSAENVTLTVNSRRITSTLAKFGISIKNENLGSIYLNNNKYADGILLSFQDGNALNSSVPAIVSNSYEIKAGEVKNFDLTYAINGLELNKMGGLLIKDVKLNDNRVVNLSYEI